MTALIAWSTHEDVHYDDFGLAMTFWAAMFSGALFLLGLGPFVPWLLGFLPRHAARLPLPFRLASRDLADDRSRTAPAIALTMIATALAVTITITEVAETAQQRAQYHPQGRPGALIVEVFTDDGAAAARTAVRHELPGVPIAQSYRPREHGHFSLGIGNVGPSETESVDPSYLIGDRALLHYLTADASTPYDENTAVVVTTADAEVDRVRIHYDAPGGGLPPAGGDTALSGKTVPAITVRPGDPRVNKIFVPAKVVRDLGFQLAPEKMIIDPSVHRVSAAEQERLDRRLGDSATTYVERGFQPSDRWLGLVGTLIAFASCGALAATAPAAVGARSRRVLRRIGGGSTATMRLFAACRTGLGTACGTVTGAVAGSVAGRMLAWPMTASADWEPIERAPFDTPWWTIIALAAGLPVLTAAIAALLPPAAPREHA
ncbi:hypothetical protein [Planobispora rosea]|uniref:hypothetical protein n=1 Tax=Planobispora rosea TaxID=35762 RepID=UPI00083AEFD1|nr:hypothetical protein [Planobispora rosea]